MVARQPRLRAGIAGFSPRLSEKRVLSGGATTGGISSLIDSGLNFPKTTDFSELPAQESMMAARSGRLRKPLCKDIRE